MSYYVKTLLTLFIVSGVLTFISMMLGAFFNSVGEERAEARAFIYTAIGIIVGLFCVLIMFPLWAIVQIWGYEFL